MIFRSKIIILRNVSVSKQTFTFNELQLLRNNIEDCFSRSLEDVTENKSPGTYDILPLDLTMCRYRLFQPMFLVDFKKNRIQMNTHIICEDSSHSIESIILTSWKDKDDDSGQEICWEKVNGKQRLIMSQKLFDRYIPRWCSSRNQCVLCSNLDGSRAVRNKFQQGHYVRKVSRNKDGIFINRCNEYVKISSTRKPNKCLTLPKSFKKINAKEYVRVSHFEKESGIQMQECTNKTTACSCTIEGTSTMVNYLCKQKWSKRNNYSLKRD